MMLFFPFHLFSLPPPLPFSLLLFLPPGLTDKDSMNSDPLSIMSKTHKVGTFSQKPLLGHMYMP